MCANFAPSASPCSSSFCLAKVKWSSLAAEVGSALPLWCECCLLSVNAICYQFNINATASQLFAAASSWVTVPSTRLGSLGFGLHCIQKFSFEAVLACHYSPRWHQVYKKDDPIRFNIYMSSHPTAYGICSP